MEKQRTCWSGVLTQKYTPKEVTSEYSVFRLVVMWISCSTLETTSLHYGSNVKTKRKNFLQKQRIRKSEGSVISSLEA